MGLMCLKIQHTDSSHTNSHTNWSGATVKVSFKARLIFVDTKSIIWVWLTVSLQPFQESSLDQLELRTWCLDKVNQK